MSVDRERIEQDARAGVMWGEDSRTVHRMLRANGLDDGEAAAVMAVLRRERAAVVRGIGVRQWVLGGCLIVVPIAYWVASLFIGFMHLKLFGLTVAVGFFGFWKVIQGAIKFFAPSKIIGSVADME